MDDRVEVLLQVDSLRQAVGGDHDLRTLDRADLRHTLLAIFGGHLAGHGVDGNARQVLAKVASHVVGGRDEATEDHHVEPSLDQLCDVLRGGPELWIATLASKCLRLPDQPRQRRAVATGRGLHVVRDERVAVAVENAIEEIFACFGAGILSGTGCAGPARPRRGSIRCSAGGPASPRNRAAAGACPRRRLHDLGAVI